MVKEMGKLYAYLQIVLKEHYNLIKIKDFLTAELTVQHIELSLQRLQYLKLIENGNSGDYQQLRAVAKNSYTDFSKIRGAKRKTGKREQPSKSEHNRSQR